MGLETEPSALDSRFRGNDERRMGRSDLIEGRSCYSHFVIPAKAGIQGLKRSRSPWILAFAGMTEGESERGSPVGSSRL